MAFFEKSNATKFGASTMVEFSAHYTKEDIRMLSDYLLRGKMICFDRKFTIDLCAQSLCGVSCVSLISFCPETSTI